jgi:hypothetical protein
LPNSLKPLIGNNTILMMWLYYSSYTHPHIDMSGTSHFWSRSRSRRNKNYSSGLGEKKILVLVLVPVPVKKKIWPRSRTRDHFSHLYPHAHRHPHHIVQRKKYAFNVHVTKYVYKTLCGRI